MPGTQMHLAQWVRTHAVEIVVWSLLINIVMLVASCVLWSVAIATHWVDSVTFVSHISMLALVFSAASGVAAALAGAIALVPTDDIVDPPG